MAPYTLQYKSNYTLLSTETRFTLSRLKADEHGQSYVDKYEDSLDRLRRVREGDEDLVANLEDFQAKAVDINGRMGGFSVNLSHQLLVELNGNKEDAAYQHLFGKLTPGALARKGFTSKIKIMRGWIPSVLTSNFASIRKLGAQLLDLIEEAQAIQKGKEEAEQKLLDYRGVGPKKDLIDGLNILRKEVHGALNALVHDPTLQLPLDFARRFFRRYRSSKVKPSRENQIRDWRNQAEVLVNQADKLQAEIDAETAAQEEAAEKLRLEQIAQKQARLEKIQKELDELQDEAPPSTPQVPAAS